MKKYIFLLIVFATLFSCKKQNLSFGNAVWSVDWVLWHNNDTTYKNIMFIANIDSTITAYLPGEDITGFWSQKNDTTIALSFSFYMKDINTYHPVLFTYKINSIQNTYWGNWVYDNFGQIFGIGYQVLDAKGIRIKDL